MIGVGEQDLDAKAFGEIALGEAFDGGLRTDGHENGRFDDAVVGVEQSGTGAGMRTLGDEFETKLRQFSG